jgi:hypothetical protein
MGGGIVRGGFVEDDLARWALLAMLDMCLPRLAMTFRMPCSHV